jgi:hypothetical protein
MDSLVGVDRLIGIYDADGGVLGEVRYALGKIFANGHCSLCDLTHRGLKRRAEWNSLVERIGVPVELLHRNEMDEPVRRVVDGKLPCILAVRGTQVGVLLGPDDLTECGTDLRELERRIRSALNDR